MDSERRRAARRSPKNSAPDTEPATNEGAPQNRKVLTGWKEIANYLGRGVRTLQRYESQYGLPIRRPGGKDHSSVMGFPEELDRWLNRSPVKNQRHVRRVLLVLDLPTAVSISSRKLVLEVGKFNVLTALSAEELYETAEKFDVDAFVIDCPPGDALATEICESLKERHPTGRSSPWLRNRRPTGTRPNVPTTSWRSTIPRSCSTP